MERLRHGREGTFLELPEAGARVPAIHLPASGDHRGDQAAGKLLDSKLPPTAIFAANDLLAIGAMHAAHERGLTLPTDLSIVGMDDIDAAAMTLPVPVTLNGFLAPLLVFILGI